MTRRRQRDWTPEIDRGDTRRDWKTSGLSIFNQDAGILEVLDGYEVHPAASIFPMLPIRDLEALAEDIRVHGLLEPILRLDGKVIDGRNRLKACAILIARGEFKLEPRHFADLPPGTDPWAYVWSTNGTRRHLPQAQLAAAAIRALDANGELEKATREAEEKANEARRSAAKNQPRGEDGTFRGTTGQKPRGPASDVPESVADELVGCKLWPEHPLYVRNARAEAVKEFARGKVSGGTISKVLRLFDGDRDLFEQVFNGEMGITVAIRKLDGRGPSPSRGQDADPRGAPARDLLAALRRLVESLEKHPPRAEDHDEVTRLAERLLQLVEARAGATTGEPGPPREEG